jgi:hypothetical protein
MTSRKLSRNYDTHDLVHRIDAEAWRVSVAPCEAWLRPLRLSQNIPSGRGTQAIAVEGLNMLNSQDHQKMCWTSQCLKDRSSAGVKGWSITIEPHRS